MNDNLAMQMPLPEADDCWRAVIDRDVRADGRFVYAVTSTGVYCRPTCPSRRPRRERVRFFFSPAAARAAGFRSCRRCRPDDADRNDPVKATVLAACRYLEEQGE